MSVTESLDAASLEKLRTEFRGHLILPGDREYDSSRIVWNAIADRWHEVEPESFALDAYEFMEGAQAVARGDGQLITTVGFMFREPGGQIVAGPLSSILAVQLPRTR